MMLWKQIIDLIFFHLYIGEGFLFREKWISTQFKWMERKEWALCCWVLKTWAPWCVHGCFQYCRWHRSMLEWLWLWKTQEQIVSDLLIDKAIHLLFLFDNFVNTCTSLFTSILMGRCNRKNMMLASLPPQSYSWIRLVHVKKI